MIFLRQLIQCLTYDSLIDFYDSVFDAFDEFFMLLKAKGFVKVNLVYFSHLLKLNSVFNAYDNIFDVRTAKDLIKVNLVILQSPSWNLKNESQK